jgi:phosphopantothenoylcysteine decarboxylase/phosphopantothenate--cysteine ligase
MTANATRFVAPLSFESVTHHPVLTNLWSEQPDMDISHIRLAHAARLVVVAPATANVIAKCALGIADDALTSLLLASPAPLLFAPAMNTSMWTNAVTQQHVAALRARDAQFVGPGHGYLAEGTSGEGRLAEASEIVAAIRVRLERRRDLLGRHFVVTAGPTQEALDPVRYLSNRSSGKMGYAIAEAARDRGADVVLISGPVSLDPPAGVSVVHVRTASELFAGVQKSVIEGSALVMAAAVADYRCADPSPRKIRRSPGELSLKLVPTVDVLGSIERPSGLRVVAFAAETDDLLHRAGAKMDQKGADLLVANDVSEPGAGFDTDTNHVWICRPGREPKEIPMAHKRVIADIILDAVVELG